MQCNMPPVWEKKGVKISVKYEYLEFNGGSDLAGLWVHYYGNSGTASV